MPASSPHPSQSHVTSSPKLSFAIASTSSSTSSSLPFPSDWSATDLCEELHRSIAASANLDKELSELVATRSTIERALAKSSPALSDSIESLVRANDGVGRIITHSHASAQVLSSKVRELGEVAANVNSALSRVENVLALRHTITRVKEKLASGTYAPAADEIYKVLYLSQPIRNDPSFAQLLELEKMARTALQQEMCEKCIRQGRANSSGTIVDASQFHTKDLLRHARIWSKLGFAYRGLVLYCSQIRLECLAFIHKSGWSLQNQHENALIDYTRNISAIIETCNNCIIQHLLVVQSAFGDGAQIRLIQELVCNVIDTEIASKLLARFIDEKRIKDTKGGTLNPNVDDVISRIKQVNQKVMSGAMIMNNSTGTQEPVTYYNPSDPATHLGAILYITTLDELLDEMKSIAAEIEHFLKGIDKLTRQSMDFLNDSVAKEKENRMQGKGATTSAASLHNEIETKRLDDIFQQFYSTPNLDTLPSVSMQQQRVMTVLYRLMHDDKHAKNLLDIPILDDRGAGTFTTPTKTSLAADAPIPPALNNLPASSPFLVSGFGLDANLAMTSRLYDMQLTIIGKYVLIEEYYMNYNVEKALAIDEHDGTSGLSLGDENATNVTASSHDDLELELEMAEQRKERAALAASGAASNGLQSLASAISNSNSGIDPYLYLTGIGGSTTGHGVPKSFLLKFATHKTSTLVDNVCFLYKKCIQRSLKISNRDAIYSILLRVHENFNKKFYRIFESSVAHYESRFGKKRKSSLMYGLFQNPGAYLLPANMSAGKTNRLGAWVASAGAGGAPSAVDIKRKINGDISLLLTINNLDSTIENMQALLKYIEQALEEMYSEEAPADTATTSQQAGTPSHASSTSASPYTRGLTLDQLREKLYEFNTTFFMLDELIQRGVQCIADNVWLRLYPRISLLHSHAQDLYAQSELNSLSQDLSDQIISGYIEVFRRDILSLSYVLNENNFYQCVFKVIKLTVRYLENLVLPKQTGASGVADPSNPSSSSSSSTRVMFTQSGGVTFDKQIRSLTSFFTNDVAASLESYFTDNYFLYLQPQNGSGGSSASSSSLNDSSYAFKQWRVSFSGSSQSRQLFSKLAHVGSILSVEKPSEVLEYTERELFNLKKDEVRRILSLRKEFSEREIQQLKL